MFAEHLNEAQKVVIELILLLETSRHVRQKFLDNRVEHAEYELNNLAIVVVDVQQMHALLKARQHERQQMLDQTGTRALDQTVQSLEEAHDLFDSGLVVNESGRDGQ